MTSIILPEPLPCPDSWKYNQEWQDQYEEKNGMDYLSKMCKHSEAGFRIMYYICDMGEKALTKIKTQNLVIKRITANTVDPTKVDIDPVFAIKYSIDGPGDYTWASLDESRDALFEVYNAQMAPADILRILDEMKAFMNAGQIHCQSLLRYLADARAAFDQQKEMEREQSNLQLMQQMRASKWAAIDEKHSKVTEGFVYLLSNALMPGIYKIGFTAGNPDKRAKEVSAHYRLPMPFEVIEYWRTKDPYIIEQRIHTALASYEKADEFFEVDLKFIKETIESYVLHQ
jgi:hypothetical protein